MNNIEYKCEEHIAGTKTLTWKTFSDSRKIYVMVLIMQRSQNKGKLWNVLQFGKPTKKELLCFKVKQNGLD